MSAADHLSESSDSRQPEMTESYSFTSDENDIFTKQDPLGAGILQTFCIRLRELYGENITAKILRAANTCLQDNVSSDKLQID